VINFFSNWIEGIAVAVIISTIFEMLLPNGNIKKYVKMILGIYIIFCIIAPFTDTKVLGESELFKKIDEYTNDSEIKNYSEYDTNKKINKIYESTFEKDLIKTIEKEGFTVYKCSVKGNFNAEDENAGITEISIILESKKTSKNNLNDNDKTEGEDIDGIDEIKKVKINVSKKNVENNIEDVVAKDIDTLKKYLSKHYEIDKGIIKIHIR